MSIAAVPGVLGGISKAVGIGGVVYSGVTQIGKALGFGGGSDVNIARSFSQGLGCDIRQSDKAYAQSFIEKGINPCNMTPLTPAQAQQRGVAQTTQAQQYESMVGGPQALPGGGMSQMNGYTQAGMISTGRQIVRSAPGILRTATGRISSIVLPSGQKYSAKRAASLIRSVGLQAAAAALGIGIIEVAELLLSQTKTRRRRGISYAQLRNAKRVACTVSRMARDLGVKPATRSRGTCR